MSSLCQGMTSYCNGYVSLKRRRKGKEKNAKCFLVLYWEISIDLASSVTNSELVLLFPRCVDKGGRGGEDYFLLPESNKFSLPKTEKMLFWCYALDCRPEQFFVPSFFCRNMWKLSTVTFPVQNSETFSIWIVLNIALLCNACPTLW